MGWYSEGRDPSFPPPPPPLASVQLVEQPVSLHDQNYKSRSVERPPQPIYSQNTVGVPAKTVKPSPLSYTQPLLIPKSEYKNSQYARPSTLPYVGSNDIHHATISKTSEVMYPPQPRIISQQNNGNQYISMSLSQPNLQIWDDHDQQPLYIETQTSVKSEYVPSKRSAIYDPTIPISTKHRKASKSQGTLLYQGEVISNSDTNDVHSSWNKPHYLHGVVYEPQIGVQHKPFRPRSKSRGRTILRKDSDQESDYNAYPPPKTLLPVGHQSPAIDHHLINKCTNNQPHERRSRSSFERNPPSGTHKTEIEIAYSPHMVRAKSYSNLPRGNGKDGSLSDSFKSPSQMELRNDYPPINNINDMIQVLTPCNQGYYHNHTQGYAPYTPPGSDTSASTGASYVQRAPSSLGSSYSAQSFVHRNVDKSSKYNGVIPHEDGYENYAGSARYTLPVPIQITPPDSAPQTPSGSVSRTSSTSVHYTPPGSAPYTPPGSAPYTPPASAPHTPVPPSVASDGNHKRSNRRRRINSKYKVRKKIFIIQYNYFRCILEIINGCINFFAV